MVGASLPYRAAPRPAFDPFGDNRVAIVGTSLVQHNTKAAANGVSHWSRGWMTWAQILDPRMRYDVWFDAADVNGRGFSGANHGVSGQSCVQVLARLDRVLRMRPAIAVLDMGTNDMAIETRQFIHEKRMLAAERLRRAGILVVLLPILARSTTGASIWPASSDMRRKAQWINQMSRYYADATPGVLLCDWNEAFVDPASPNGDPYAGYSDDGTHFSVTGAFAIARKIVETLQALLPPGQAAFVSPEDKFDAAENPLGNLTPNPLMTGNGGSVGAPVTGEVADLMRVERSSGTACTGAASLAPRPGRSQWQKLAISPAGSAVESFLIRPAATDIVFPVVADAWWQATCDVSLSAYAGWRGCELRANLYAGATSTGAMIGLERYDVSGVRLPMPSEAWSGTIRTPPFQLAGGVDRTRLRLEVAVDGSVAGAPTVQAGSMTLRQVPDPRPLWRM